MSLEFFTLEGKAVGARAGALVSSLLPVDVSAQIPSSAVYSPTHTSLNVTLLLSPYTSLTDTLLTPTLIYSSAHPYALIKFEAVREC